MVLRPSPEKFYKGRSQEKIHLLRLEFFLLRSPTDRAKSVLTDRAMCSVVGQGRVVVWIFSTSGFHRFFGTKPVSSETSKAERWSNLAAIVLLGTRWPIAFSGYPRGPSLVNSRFYWRKKKGCSKRSDEHWVLAEPSIPFRSIPEMTSCCIPQLSFSFYRHRAIRADFSGGQISSDAGLLPSAGL